MRRIWWIKEAEELPTAKDRITANTFSTNAANQQRESQHIMGTRADFYIGRGKNAQWIGSTAWDGYPDGIVLSGAKLEYGREHSEFPKGEHLFDSLTEQEFRSRLTHYFENRDDVTLPEQGWPWPWENSNTTDFAYAFDGCKVYGTCFGHGWWIANEGPPDDDENTPKTIEWPDMKTDRMARAGSNRSGVMVFTA